MSPPPEINAFEPLRMRESPSRRAEVNREAASEPALGSVRQYEANFWLSAAFIQIVETSMLASCGKYVSFRVSEPY